LPLPRLAPARLLPTYHLTTTASTALLPTCAQAHLAAQRCAQTSLPCCYPTTFPASAKNSPRLLRTPLGRWHSRYAHLRVYTTRCRPPSTHLPARWHFPRRACTSYGAARLQVSHLPHYTHCGTWRIFRTAPLQFATCTAHTAGRYTPTCRVCCTPTVPSSTPIRRQLPCYLGNCTCNNGAGRGRAGGWTEDGLVLNRAGNP